MRGRGGLQRTLRTKGGGQPPTPVSLFLVIFSIDSVVVFFVVVYMMVTVAPVRSREETWPIRADFCRVKRKLAKCVVRVRWRMWHEQSFAGLGAKTVGTIRAAIVLLLQLYCSPAAVLHRCERGPPAPPAGAREARSDCGGGRRSERVVFPLFFSTPVSLAYPFERHLHVL